MRLIDADELLNRLHYKRTWTIENIVAAFIDAPNVDAVPVIRCADCISSTYNEARDIIWCDYHHEYLTPNNYCSLGIKKIDKRRHKSNK